MVNRIVSRLRVGACLLGLFSFVFATAQTPPVADDDSLPIAILIKALTPACSSFTATPVSVLAGGSVALAATCTNSPTTYEWYRDTTLLATTATATYSTTAPTTVATYIYSVVAKRGSIPSLRKSANVSVITVPPLSVSAAASTTVGTAVAIQGTFNAPANSANVRVSIGNSPIANISNVTSSFSTSWTPTQSGVYQVRVEAISIATSQVLATNTTKVVVAELPAATALAVPGTSSAGATAGGFGVSDMGGAQYSIPISIPPGIAGMQPSVSLSYSSTGGNGHVGVGWAIGGLSAISRCPKTIAQDGVRAGINYDKDIENDAFCLDGQRLIPVGTPSLAIGQAVSGVNIGEVKVREYRTEIDRYDRILSYEATSNSAEVYKNNVGGPSNFKVFSKSGQIMEYGSRWWSLNNGNSQVASDPDRGNTVRVWPLDKVADRNGNYYVVDYAGNANLINSGPAIVTNSAPGAIKPVGAFPQVEFYPAQITYTFNKGKNLTSVNRVIFEYGDRPANDRHVLFDSGAGQHILTKRLQGISTYIDGQIIDYDNIPLPNPLTNQNLYPICSGAQCGTKVKEYRLAYDATPATTRSRLVSLEECASDGVCLPKTTFAWTGYSKNLLGAGSGVKNLGAADVNDFKSFTVADVDGDGRSDLVRRYGASNTGHVQVLLSRGDTFETRDLYRSGGGEIAGPDATSYGFGDFNGDGRADFFGYNPVNGGFFRLCLTNVGATAMDCTDYPPSVIQQPSNDYFLQGDFDGDGKTDLLLFRGLQNAGNVATATYDWDLLLGTSTGLSTTPRRVRTPYGGGTMVNGKLYAFSALSTLVGDFNGDGRADLLMRKVPEACVTRELSFKTEAPCTPPRGTSAGPTDSISWQMFLSTPEIGPSNLFAWTPREVNLENTKYPSKYRATIDFNGDGLADVFTEKKRLCLSGGDGSFGSFETVIAGSATDGYTSGGLCRGGPNDPAGLIDLPSEWSSVSFDEIIFGDFDGDGRTDMMMRKPNSKANICLARSSSDTSTPKGNIVYFECGDRTPFKDANGVPDGTSVGDWALATNESFADTKVGDFNGDGKTDLVSSVTGNTHSVILSLAGDATGTSATKTLSDQIVRITNGLGAFTEIVYAPITDNSVYTKGTGQTGNRIDIQSPMYVVKSTSSSNGIGGTFDTAYTYEGLVGETTGRGLMGFAKRTVTHNNGASSVRTEMTYEQGAAGEWWKAGRIKSVRKFLDTSTDPINEAINTYAAKASPLSAKVIQVHLVSTIEKSWNVNKTNGREALPYTITDTPLADIDQYGNVGKVIATSYEPSGTANRYSKVTVNTFGVEDPTNWILGRLSSASVTHNMPGPTASTSRSTARTSSFDYYPASGQLKTERVEPNSANLDELLTTTYTYGDPFGQRTQTKVDFYENGVPQSRSSTTAYTADGRFVASMTNAYSQTVTYTGYDRRFGGVTSSKGINGLVGNTFYDAFGRKVGEELKDSAGNRLAMSIMTYSPFPNASSPTGVIVNTKNHTGSESQAQADSLGREVSSSALRFDGTSVASITTYDAFGRKAWVSGPRGGTGTTSAYLTTTFEYDKLARPIAQVIRAGKNAPAGTVQTRTTTEYGVQAVNGTTYSLLTAVQDGAQYAGASATHTIVKYTDSQGRTFKITDNATKDTTYGYDPLGNLENVTGPGAISETMTYDVRGRKKSSTNANITGKYTYVYNGAGELISQTDPKLQTTTMTYDLLGRMDSRTEAGSFTFVSTWTYDNSATGPRAGKLWSNTGGGTTHTFIYDAQNRLTQTDSTIVGKTYNRYTLYNAQGQVSYVGYPDSANDVAPFGVRHSYNAYGYATTVARQDNPGEIYWTTTNRFDDGSLTTANHGGALYEKDYDPLGRQSAIRLKQSNGAAAQSSTYSYDAIGNVLSRSQSYASLPANNYTENFCYDKLNRVTSSSTATGCSSPQFSYSDDGNLLAKGGSTGNIGTITYGSTARTNNAGPHAVASANGKNYVYDANGNFTNYSPNTDGAGNRTSYVDYMPFNLPLSITGSNANISGLTSTSVIFYDYDADHTRVGERVVSGLNSGTSTTYVGPGFFEVANNANGSKEYRHYIGGPDGTIGIRTVAVDASNNVLTSANGQTTRYWFKDHLGSPASEYDAGAVNLTPMGFDTWGLRRKNTSANNFTQSLSTADLASYQSPRGYTGHEHLDDVGLIHMNGRIYDPMIGRFMQPDPVISEPYNSQNFNRYAYVLNNPLMYTDPSGYSTWTEIRRPVAAIVVAIVTQGAVQMWGADAFAGELAISSAMDGGAAAAQATIDAYATVASGFAAGGVSGGNIQSAIAGAFSAGLFFGVGELGLGSGSIGNIAAHAAAGCVSAGVQGGSCKAGALSAGFAEFAGPRLLTGNMIADTAVHATLGGIGSLAGGGKFGNGAITGAFGYLFNCGVHDCTKPGAAYPEPGPAWSGQFSPVEEPGLIQVCAIDCIAGIAGVGRGIFRALVGNLSNAPPDPIPSNAKKVLEYVESNGGASPSGYKGAGKFENDGRANSQVLPKANAEGKPITYKEYDVNVYQKGVNRGAERIVRGSDNKAYYTNDHYRSFKPMN
jgi:RHS repeat-associated protein